MFVQLLRKSILRRKSRFAMGVASVLIGAAVVTALLTVSLGVGDQVGQEFSKYGADLICSHSRTRYRSDFRVSP